ncbi:MAG: oligopeptide transport system substrate-binding protein [Prosthecobacter sp.]|nr:oligopeptide transport system substrate-binding protein [Prosthecobacter sp.]
MLTSRVTRLALAAALLLSLVACGKSRPRADLVFINGAEPESIDPHIVTDQVGMRIASALFEGLCRIDEAGKPQPGLAERWDMTPDRKTYTFHLRPDTTWSDGTALTTQDFLYSWQRILTPELGADYATQLYVIKNARGFHEGTLKDFTQVGVTALDDRTLRVELENPTPYFIDLCAITPFSPVPKHVVEKLGTAWIKPGSLIGNGSYTLEEWLLDDRISLRRNERYWDAANVPLKTIDSLPISEPNTAINYFLTGQADLIIDKGMVPTSLTAKLKQQPYFHTGPFLGSFFTRFSVTRAPFDNPKIRLAFSLTIDRKRITEKITQLGERIAFSLTPPGAGQNYQPPPGPEFNPTRARELLAEAGYPDGKGFPRVEYLFFYKPVERNIAVELQAMWQEHLGISVDLAKQEWKIYLNSMKEKDYRLCRSSWVGDYNDPGTFLEMFHSSNGNNRTGWASPQYDELIAAAAREPDQHQRNTLFQQAEKLLVTDDAVILPIYHYVGVQFYHADRLTGVQPNMIDDHPFRCMRWKK